MPYSFGRALAAVSLPDIARALHFRSPLNSRRTEADTGAVGGVSTWFADAGGDPLIGRLSLKHRALLCVSALLTGAFCLALVCHVATMW